MERLKNNEPCNIRTMQKFASTETTLCSIELVTKHIHMPVKTASKKASQLGKGRGKKGFRSYET